MRDIRYKVRVGWAGRDAGVARVGTAKVAPAINTLGYDRVGYPFTPSYSGVYDDLSAPGRYAAIDFSISRGRPDRWSNVVAGECVLNVHDMGDGRYNPDNSASPLYELLVPMIPCKISAVAEDGATEIDLFHGWLDESTDTPDIGTQRATFNFKDLFMWLDGDNPVIEDTGPIYVGEAIGLILDWFSWTNPVLRNLANGTLLPTFSADGSHSGLALISDMLAVDLGIFFHSRDNVATYYDRYEWARRDSIGSFATSTAVVHGVARKNVKNTASATYVPPGGGSGTKQTYQDDASKDRYGPLKWPDVNSAYFGSDDNAMRFARYRVSQGRLPTPPVWTYRVSEGFTGDFDKIAGIDLVDRLTIDAPIAADYHLEKLVHRGASGVLFQSDLTLSKRSAHQAALVGRATVAPTTSSPGYDIVPY